MIILLLIVWYLLGSVLGLYLYNMAMEGAPILIKHVLFFLTIGGIYGLITILVLLVAVLSNIGWFNKKVFN